MIDRRTFLAALGAAGQAGAAARPNIALFLADDLGWADVGCYGAADIRTPNIDAIARSGVRFTQFYSNGPECSPTRTALLTGRYQQRVGGLECAIGVGDTGRYDDAEWLQKRGELGLPPEETSIAQMLKTAGYDTGCFGKWHLGYPEQFRPTRHGFDEAFGILGGNADYFTHREEDGRQVLFHNDKMVERKGYLTDLFAEEAVAWLKQRGARPFFLYLPFTSPHTPIQDPDGFDPARGTAPWKQGDRGIYARMVERMDRGIGDIVARLPRNTLVIFMSDNGGDPNGNNGHLRGRKSSLWEGGIRVACAARWTGVLPEGRTIAQPAIGMDWVPTLLAAAGVRAPAGRKFDGVNLLPVMKGERQPFARTLFWRSKRGTSVRKAVRDGNRKLVIDEGEELHDLSTDEREQKNLLPAAGEEVRALKGKLAAWELDVMAPRLRAFRNTPG